MLDVLKKFFENKFVKSGLLALGVTSGAGVMLGVTNYAVSSLTGDNIVEVALGYIPTIFIFFHDLFNMFVTFFNLIPSPFGTVIVLFLTLYTVIFTFKLFYKN